MPAKQSQETRNAIRLYRERGIPLCEAAATAGINRSTLYRALKKPKKSIKKRLT